MSRQSKKIGEWKHVRSPVSAEEVESVVNAVFGSRVSVATGTSHQLKIDVHELAGTAGPFRFGKLVIPIKSGQAVKGDYLRDCYKAAVALKLYVEETEEEGQHGENRPDADP